MVAGSITCVAGSLTYGCRQYLPFVLAHYGLMYALGGLPALCWRCFATSVPNHVIRPNPKPNPNPVAPTPTPTLAPTRCSTT